MTTPSLPICPHCKQTDQVQKVSSLYGLNTKEWIETSSYTFTYFHLDGFAVPTPVQVMQTVRHLSNRAELENCVY